MNRLRLEFATLGFLSEMRKQFALLHPDKECPIGSFEEYSPEQRSALMAAVQKAIKFGADESDALFIQWRQRREEQAAQSSDSSPLQ